MIKALPITAIVSVMLATACNNTPGKEKQDPGKTGPVQQEINIGDTLPDTPQFNFRVDDQSFSISSSDVSVSFSGSDSTLTVTGGKDDTARLNIVISDAKHVPGFRGNAWRSGNTKLAGSDSLVWQPTVQLYKNMGTLLSWNNFSDGYHEAKPAEDKSVYIYSLRQTGTRTFLLKGRINTRVLKNVYSESAKEFNKDHTIQGAFVIEFEDYWLKL